MELLFQEKERINPSPSTHLEGQYQFLDRCSHPGLVVVREKINSWFQRYPESEQAELKQRFNVEFSSAFFELFLHELFLQLEFDVVVHPDVPGTTKKPDFLVQKGDMEFYIEAKEVTDITDTEKSTTNKFNKFYDELNNINSPNFFLNVKELIFKSMEQPSAKKAKRHFEEHLDKYDPDIVTEEFKRGGLYKSNSIIYEDQKVKITISLIPKSKLIRGKKGIRPIGMYPVESFWGNTDESIKNAISKKATRYGMPDKPYVVFINSTGFLTDEYSILSALFGSLKVSLSTTTEDLNEKWFRERNGVFMGPKGPQFTRISGVFISTVYISNLHVAKYNIYKHPFSKNPLNFDEIGLEYSYVNENELVQIPGKSITEILGIPNDWFENWNFNF